MDNKKVRKKSKKSKKSKKFEPNKTKTAHSRFLKTAPSLVALLGITADSTHAHKSDKVIFNELLLKDNKKSDKKMKGSKKKKNSKNSKKDKDKKKKKKSTAKPVKKTKAKNKNVEIDKKENEQNEANQPNGNMEKQFETERKEAELNLLKKQAAAELKRLADENDDLFHEKEVLRLKYDDLQHEIQLLQQSNNDSQIYKQENDRLKLMIENYKSETATLKTEIIMVTELINNNNNNNNNDTTNTTDTATTNNDQIEKMDAIKKLIREKNDILTEFDELKMTYDANKKETVLCKKQLSESQHELSRLSEELQTERIQNFAQNKRQTDRINDLNKKMELSKDELLLEYEKKEQQFIQTVEEQLKYIDELENENQNFQIHHTRKASLDNQSGNGMYSLLRLKTQANIFGDNYNNSNHGTGTGHDYDNSVSFDDNIDYDYEYMNDDHADNNTPISVASVISGDGTFIEHSDDVGNPLLVTLQSPNRDAMSSYLEMMKTSQHNKQQMLDAVQQEKERQQQQQQQLKRKEEREKILAAQQQQTVLDGIVGKMKENINKNMKLNAPIEQTSIRALGYFINKNGKLLAVVDEEQTEQKEEKEEKEQTEQIGLLSWSLEEHTYTQLQNAITIYLFDTLLKYYNFRPKQIGKVSGKTKRGNKKNQIIQIDYQYKTLLFSANFSKTDTLFVMIPPFRGGICYWNLCVDKGIVYGTLLSYIEFALSFKCNKSKTGCGVLLLDPKGLDTNATPWSIFKIYDKFISKRVRNKKIKKIVFIGALKEGNLISHLLDRRGKELKNVVKACIFLGCDDPYTAREHTANIYKKCAVNFIDSTKQIGTQEMGTKSNGDKYYIPRQSSGMANFCAISAYPKVIETVKKALSE